MIDGQKLSIVLRILWLIHHNPEVNMRIGEVKIIRCSENIKSSRDQNKENQSSKNIRKKEKKGKKQEKKKEKKDKKQKRKRIT